MGAGCPPHRGGHGWALKWVLGGVDTPGVDSAPIPHDDKERVTSLRRLGLLDTAPEERFDRITRTARRLFGVDTALVSLVDADRQWFKSKQGLAADEFPRDISFCGPAIVDSDVLVIPDTRDDDRFGDNPLVASDPTVRFYAGCPIAGPDGALVGTLCLIDHRPHALDDEDIRSLRDLAAMVEREIAVTRLAVDDELTGLANRRGFMMMASQALAFCQRQHVDALVVVADVDGIESVNDRFGDHVGDQLLRHAASAMAEAFRASDVVGRLGGDEFGAVLTAYHGEAPWATKRLAAAVQACNDQIPDAPFTLSMAVGSARFDPDDPELLEALLDRAGTAMSADKEFRRQLATHRDPV
jgi:diguanylate cyclase (GGDEF)-like protein